MLFNTNRQKSILESLEYLPNDSMLSLSEEYSLIRVIEKANDDKYAVSLEEAISMSNKTGDSLDIVKSNIAKANMISESDLCFYVRPSSIIANEQVREEYNKFLDEGVEVFGFVYRNPYLEAFSDALSEAVKYDCTEMIDELSDNLDSILKESDATNAPETTSAPSSAAPAPSAADKIKQASTSSSSGGNVSVGEATDSNKVVSAAKKLAKKTNKSNIDKMRDMFDATYNRFRDIYNGASNATNKGKASLNKLKNSLAKRIRKS